MNRPYFLADVSGLLSRLAAAGDWSTYFQLLAMCEPPEAYDPRKRQRIPRVVDVKGEG